MTMTLSPFDIINDLSHKKTDLMRNGEATEKDYNSYLINKAFHYFEDTIMLSNQMNILYELDKQLQHDFYLHSIRPKKRYSKWNKKISDDAGVLAVCEYYNINITRAKEYIKLLDKKCIDEIIIKTQKGGQENDEKGRISRTRSKD